MIEPARSFLYPSAVALLGALSIGAVVMGIARRSVALGLIGWVLVSLTVCALLAGRGLRRR